MEAAQLVDVDEGVLSSDCSSDREETLVERLLRKVAKYRKKLKKNRKELSSVRKKKSKLEQKLETSENFNESLRKEIHELRKELHKFKNSPPKQQQTGKDHTENLPAAPVEQDEECKSSDFLKEGATIAEVVAATAKAAVSQMAAREGFFYDKTSGLYYDSNSGYYFDAERQMYYEPHSGTYYYYDETSQSYKIHSQIKLETTKRKKSKTAKKKMKRKSQDCDNSDDNKSGQWSGDDKKKVKKIDKESSRPTKESKEEWMSKRGREDDDGYEVYEGEEEEYAKEIEDGEIEEDSDRGEEDDSQSSCSSEEEAVSSEDQMTNKRYWPPAVRLIVRESSALQEGTLFVVSVTGGTIGRELQSHSVLVEDEDVSKNHAEIRYKEEERRYFVVDCGSRSGTVLNDLVLSPEPGQVSQPYQLRHKDLLRIGAHTGFEVHIHPGDETCEGCEPGLLLQGRPPGQGVAGGSAADSREDRERQRRRQLNQIKRKYHLSGANYEAGGAEPLDRSRYQDRAEERRRTVGSDLPHCEDLPTPAASVDVPIVETNRGHRLLKKMGWSQGQGLGREGEGRTQPVPVVLRSKQSGLGAAGSQRSIDRGGEGESRANQNWERARRRYQKLEGALGGSAEKLEGAGEGNQASNGQDSSQGSLHFKWNQKFTSGATKLVEGRVIENDDSQSGGDDQ